MSIFFKKVALQTISKLTGPRKAAHKLLTMARLGKLFKKAQITFLVFSFMYVVGQLLGILYIELWQS